MIEREIEAILDGKNCARQRGGRGRRRGRRQLRAAWWRSGDGGGGDDEAANVKDVVVGFGRREAGGWRLDRVAAC